MRNTSKKSLSNFTDSQKCKTLEFGNLSLRRKYITSIAYFEPTVYITISISQPGLGFQYAYKKLVASFCKTLSVT